MPIRTDLSTDREPVEVLAEDFALRQRKGERPTMREYQEAYPALADEIADVFPAILTLQQVNPNDSEFGFSVEPSSAAPLSDQELEHKTVGEYRILREIGRGGMGIVYEAEQPALNRRVALKLLPAQTASGGSRKTRFAREARAVAKLHHTNIVPVYNVGADGDVLYYTMQFIRGDSLDNIISALCEGVSSEANVAQRKRPHTSSSLRDAATETDQQASGDLVQPLQPSPNASYAAGIANSLCGPMESHLGGGPQKPPSAVRSSEVKKNTASIQLANTKSISGTRRREIKDFFLNAARIGAQVADAIEYSHSQGILHRDIKPGNLLMDDRGRVWLTDFGLARLDEEEVRLTETGDIIGTLRYMAPEVFNGVNDPRNDVYSLGLTLYELVCLQPAFSDAERHVLLRKVMAGDTARISSVRDDVPGDLVTIIEKAIATNADARYQTAGDLRDDLNRFLEDQPILARQMSVVERLHRWKRREPRLATAIATAVIATIIGIIGVSYNWLAAAAARDNALIAEAAERKEKDNAVAAEIEAQKQRVKAEKATLAAMEARRDAEEARDAQARLREEAEIKAYATQMALAQVSWENDDIQRTLNLLEAAKPAEGQTDRREWEWYYLNRLCHSEIWSATGHSGTGTAWSVDVSRDGKLVASGGGGDLYFNNTGHEKLPGEVILRDFGSGEEVGRLEGHLHRVVVSRFQPHGNRLISCDFDGVAKLWDVTTLKEIATLPKEFGPYSEAQFSPDGTRLLMVSTDKHMCIFDPAEPSRPTKVIAPNTYRLQSAAFSPDGRQIVTIDGATGGGGIEGVSCRPVVWSTETGDRVSEFAAPQGFSVRPAPFPNIIRWTPDGKRLVAGLSGQAGATVAVWNVESKECERSLVVAEMRVIHSVECSGDGQLVACGTSTSTVLVVDIVAGKIAAQHKGHTDAIRHVAFGPNDARLASIDVSGELKVWDQTREQRHILVNGLHQGVELAFSADSRRIHALTPLAQFHVDAESGVLVHDGPPEEELLVSRFHIRFPRGDGVINSAAGWLGHPCESWFDILRLGDGTRINRLQLETEKVHSAAVDSAGNILALCTGRYHEFGTEINTTPSAGIRLYNAHTFELLRIVDLPPELKAATRGCQNCRLNTDGSLLAATFNGVGDASEVVIVDTARGIIVDRIAVNSVQNDEGEVPPLLTEVDFHPTLPHVATLNTNISEMMSWTLTRDKKEDGAMQHKLNFTVKTIPVAYSMSYSPVGHRIAVANQPNRVQLLDARSGTDVVVLRSQDARKTSANNPRVRFSPDGQTLACFNQSSQIAIWNTSVAPPKDRLKSLQTRLPDWHRGMLDSTEGKGNFVQAFHLTRLLKDLPEGNQRDAAFAYHTAGAKWQAGSQYTQSAAEFENAFNASPHWILAAESALAHTRNGDRENALRMVGIAARTRFANQPDRPAYYHFQHHIAATIEHFVLAQSLADSINAADPEEFERLINDLFPGLDPENPIHAAVASMGFYRTSDLPPFDWKTALKTIQNHNSYPGTAGETRFGPSRPSYFSLLARLNLLNNKDAQALKLLDKIIIGDSVYEANLAKRYQAPNRKHLMATIVHEKVEARLLKAIVLRRQGDAATAAAELAKARAAWDSVADQTAKLDPGNTLSWCRVEFVRAMLKRLE